MRCSPSLPAIHIGTGYCFAATTTSRMARLLRRLATTDYGFDCGANIGYWSVYVASRSCGGGKPVLAVEASAATFALLQTNATAFPDRIRIVHPPFSTGPAYHFI